MISSSVTEALGWTLLHSLWQISLVALAFYLICQFLRRPTHVYRWGVGALLAVAGWSLYTFVDLYEPEKNSSSTVTHLADPVVTTHSLPLRIAEPVAPLSAPSWIDNLAAWINPYLGFITLCWLLGIIILATRLVGGLWYLSRLKHLHTVPLLRWETTLTMLTHRLGLRRPVKVLASGVVKVPMVIGYLKPVILFPVALASSLSPEHIEAILAHELAHLHRHDYWVNILQSLVEVLFFYHPAVWWMSAVVREEREKCCDDLAVSLCGNTLVYAKALSEAETLRQTPSPLALALAQRRSSLLARIERLVHPRTSTSSPAVKLLSVAATLLLVIYFAGSDTLAQMAEKDEPWLGDKLYATSSQPGTIPMASDTIKPKQETSEEEGWQESGKARTFAPPPIPNSTLDEQDERVVSDEDERQNQFSFHLDDSTDFMFDLNFDVDEDFDSDDSRISFHFGDNEEARHNQLKIHFNDTVPTFSWNDSLWLESIGELSEYMGTFAEEFTGYIRDSVDTDELQARLGAVQQELEHLQSELGTSLQRSFDEERMEKWWNRSQKENEEILRELQRIKEKSQERNKSKKESEEILQELERELQRMKEKSQERIHDRQTEAHEHRNFDDTIDRLESALLADKLIEKGKEYRFELKPKGLYINRKKQDNALTKKYRDLLEITESTNFSITRVAE